MTKKQAVASGREDVEFNVPAMRTDVVFDALVMPGPIIASITRQADGATRGLTQAKFRTADAPLDKVSKSWDGQTALRESVFQKSKKLTLHPLFLVKKPLPPGEEEEFMKLRIIRSATLAWVPEGQTASYYLKSQGADTALEIQVLDTALNGDGIINPSLSFSSKVKAALWRVSDGREVYSCVINYRSPTHKFAAWGKDDARLLREELDLFAEQVSSTIVGHLGLPAWGVAGGELVTSTGR